MRAVLCKDWGGPQTLVVEEVPEPSPGPGEVCIEVHAASVNFADTLMIAGKYQVKPERPFSPGMEVGGVVSACGEGVSGLAVGQRVMAVTGQGAYAERVVAPEKDVFAIPDSMPFDEAASFPVAYGTSHLGLCRRAQLKAGEVLLVHGAAGGVGITAVEIGRHLGATVIATAGTDAKLAIARSHGAHHGVDYAAEDVRERVLELTGGRGADVIYDPVGGDVFDASLRCINWEGRILVVGFAAGRIPSAPANYLLVKNCATIGVFWGAYSRRDPATLRAGMEALLGWYEEGALKPHISLRYSMDEVPAAMNALLERRSTGKVVISIR
ncbi:MAG: zinc-binding dehydrogenase [Gammaproteobacteria bacterium]|nr:zinc-binding dehydrogenase [Gammaproteobacteria bacterium]